MQEIKNCQFCGSDDQKVVSFLSSANSPVAEHYVICDNCGAQGPIAVNSEMAIKKWNSRIQEVPDTQERPLITTWMEAENAYCPLRNGACRNSLCMMWLRIGDNKGRCGLVNTMYINLTGCGA